MRDILVSGSRKKAHKEWILVRKPATREFPQFKSQRNYKSLYFAHNIAISFYSTLEYCDLQYLCAHSHKISKILFVLFN
jgi:hypothetical protein